MLREKLSEQKDQPFLLAGGMFFSTVESEIKEKEPPGSSVAGFNPTCLPFQRTSFHVPHTAKNRSQYFLFVGHTGHSCVSPNAVILKLGGIRVTWAAGTKAELRASPRILVPCPRTGRVNQPPGSSDARGTMTGFPNTVHVPR